jgi:hypothetical protein
VAAVVVHTLHQEVVVLEFLVVVLGLMVVVVGVAELQQEHLIQVLIHILHLQQLDGDILVGGNLHIQDLVVEEEQEVLEVVLQVLQDLVFRFQQHLKIQK